MSFRTLVHLRSVAPQPGRLLKHLTPTAANATVPSSTAAPYKLLFPRISYSSAHASPSPMPPPPRNFLGTGHGSFSVVKTKDPEKKGEDTLVTAGGDDHGRQGTQGSRSVVQRSKAYEFFAEMYVLVYVLSWVLGRFTFLAARDGLRRLRRYVREKFSQKR